MKKISLLLLSVLAISLSKAQTKYHGDTALTVYFDIRINDSVKDIDNYYFEMICPTLDIKFKIKSETKNISCNIQPNSTCIFIFTYKQCKPVTVSIKADTIKSKQVTLPVRIYEQTISKRIQARGS